MRRPTCSLVLITVLAAAGMAGCSSGDASPRDPDPAVVTTPPVEAFTEGACRTAAPTVLDTGRALGELGEQPPTEDLLGRLAVLQTSLAAAPASAVTPQVQELVAGIGFVRLRTASGSYGVDLRDSVLQSYTALVDTCTGQPVATPTPTPS